MNGAWVVLTTPANVIGLGERYHLAFTWDGATMRIYRNGTELASRAAAGTMAASTYNLVLGVPTDGYNASGSSYFKGMIDEVALYDRALTTAEVRDHNRVGRNDTDPPDTTIVSKPADVSGSTAPSVGIASSESSSSFECRLDAGAWAACQSTKSYSGLAVGTHTFEARAIDPAFNVDPTPASFTWDVGASDYRDSLSAMPGLISHWRLGEPEGVGAGDEAGANHATFAGSPGLGAIGLLTGDPDPAVDFDGVNDNVNVPNSATLHPTTSMSWEGWIEPDSVACSRQLVDGGNRWDLVFGCNGDLRLAMYSTATGWYYLSTPTAQFAAGQRYHVAITWDGTTTRIYRNGQQVASGSFPGPLGTTGNAIIGADSNGTVARGSYYDGTMDEVALYDRALTGAEVLGHYDAGTGAP